MLKINKYHDLIIKSWAFKKIDEEGIGFVEAVLDANNQLVCVEHEIENAYRAWEKGEEVDTGSLFKFLMTAPHPSPAVKSNLEAITSWIAVLDKGEFVDFLMLELSKTRGLNLWDDYISA